MEWDLAGVVQNILKGGACGVGIWVWDAVCTVIPSYSVPRYVKGHFHKSALFYWITDGFRQIWRPWKQIFNKVMVSVTHNVSAKY